MENVCAIYIVLKQYFDIYLTVRDSMFYRNPKIIYTFISIS